MASLTVNIDISPVHRSREENQERAFVAASRRKDRSLDARLESACRASALHKQRTGKALNITKEIVENEAMYEEIDERLPERRILMLQTQNEQVEERFQRQLIAIFGSPNGIPQSCITTAGTRQMRSDTPLSDPRMVDYTIPTTIQHRPCPQYSSPVTPTTTSVASPLSQPPARVSMTRCSYMPTPEDWSSAIPSATSASIWPIPSPYMSATSSAPLSWLTSQIITPPQQPPLEPLVPPLNQGTQKSDLSALEAWQHQVLQQPSMAPGSECPPSQSLPYRPRVASAPELSMPAPPMEGDLVQSNDAAIMQDDRAQSEPSYEEYLEEIDRSTDPGLLMGFLDPELESQLPETTTSPETCTTPELDMSPSPTTTPKSSPCPPLSEVNDQSTVMVWTEDQDTDFSNFFSQLAWDLENDSEPAPLEVDSFLLDDVAMFDGELVFA